MLVKFKVCKNCGKSYKATSRHSNCPSCRNKLCRKSCNNCAKEIQCGGKTGLCHACSNSLRLKQSDLKSLASSYALNKCRSRKKHEVTISKEYLVSLLDQQNGRCAYTNLPMSLPTFKGCSDKRLCASLDRIDSSKGYIVGNVQWVIVPINLMKGTLSHNETLELVRWIKNE